MLSLDRVIFKLLELKLFPFTGMLESKLQNFFQTAKFNLLTCLKDQFYFVILKATSKSFNNKLSFLFYHLAIGKVVD